MILNEGGNVFPDVTAFDHENVPEILNKLQRAISDTGIRLIPVGSAATPKPGKKSGDMDVIADEEQVLAYFNAKDSKSARKALNDYVASQGFQTAQSGINVHVRVPVGSEAHQVDIMVTPKAEKVSRFHTHDIPDKSPYKGVNKQLMMAILAKRKGYMWSAWQGLFGRTAEGKKGDFISDDLDEIAQILLGDGAKAKNLGSVEAILKSLPEEEAQILLAKAEEDPNWQPKKQEKVDEGPQHWFREIAAKLAEATAPKMPIKQPAQVKPATKPNEVGQTIKSAGFPALLRVEPPPMPQGKLQAGEKLEPQADGTTIYSGGFGSYTYDKAGKPIKYVTPNFSGISQSVDLITGNINIRYIAGPLDVSANFDKTGKPLDSMQAQYDLGLGVFGIGKDNGITTKSWTARGPSEEDPITQKDMYAMGNKDKEATYDRAMRQVQQTSADKETLEAMLRIARLR